MSCHYALYGKLWYYWRRFTSSNSILFYPTHSQVECIFASCGAFHHPLHPFYNLTSDTPWHWVAKSIWTRRYDQHEIFGSLQRWIIFIYFTSMAEWICTKNWNYLKINCWNRNLIFHVLSKRVVVTATTWKGFCSMCLFHPKLTLRFQPSLPCSYASMTNKK